MAENVLTQEEQFLKTEQASSAEVVDVDISRGIFQGDSLLPLLFVICIISLTLILICIGRKEEDIRLIIFCYIFQEKKGQES